MLIEFLTTRFWDIMLVLVVTIQATILAYVPSPKWKALILIFPFPFTLAVLALGKPVDSTNVLGLFVMILYLHAVRILYTKLKCPIVLAIAISAICYCLVGATLAYFLPASETLFWVLTSLLLIVSIIIHFQQSGISEPPHRTPLPAWVKTPIVMGVIILIILIKNLLAGFVSFFPMVGVVGCYEARNSLMTLCKKIPLFVMAMVPLLMACRLAQGPLGIGPALAIGWGVYLAILIPAMVFEKGNPLEQQFRTS